MSVHLMLPAQTPSLQIRIVPKSQPLRPFIDGDKFSRAHIIANIFYMFVDRLTGDQSEWRSTTLGF